MRRTHHWLVQTNTDWHHKSCYTDNKIDLFIISISGIIMLQKTKKKIFFFLVSCVFYVHITVLRIFFFR